MTTNKPEVVAYHHINKENPEHRGVSLHHDASCTSTLINTEPLIRLSDHHAALEEFDRQHSAYYDEACTEAMNAVRKLRGAEAKNSQLLIALRAVIRSRDDNTGHEPSASVFQRDIDEAKKLLARLEERKS